MLGQLLHSINPTRRVPTRPPIALQSDTEESHTRGLLWPDANTLYQPDAFPRELTAGGSSPGGSSFDGPRGEIDLEHSRDIRIIIAQDEAGTTPRAVLF